MFESKYKVMIGDLNYGGHMGNDRALIVFQQTRIEWLNSLGYSETDIKGNGLIQLESHVYYLKEVLLNQVLTCRIAKVEKGRATFDIEYEIFNEDGDMVLRGSTKMALFDYEKHKLVRGVTF